MNKKYQGRYSPDVSDDFESSISRRKLKIEDKMLNAYAGFGVVIAIAGASSIIIGKPYEGLFEILGGIGIGAAIKIIKEGLEVEARKIAPSSSLPRKTFGGVLLGACVGIVTYASDPNFALAFGMGLVSAIGIFMRYGFDSFKRKESALGDLSSVDANRASEAISSAEKVLEKLVSMSRRLPTSELRRKLADLATSASELFRTIEDNPTDYKNARRYLGVYLEGLKDATTQYLELSKHQDTTQATDKYTALLGELDQGFQQKRLEILSDSQMNLDIEIDVLRERLAADGVSLSENKTKE